MVNNSASEILIMTIERIEGAYAPSTIRAYRSDFAEFIGFCGKSGLNPIPASPTTLAAFIANLADNRRSSASIRRAVAGISTIHRLNRLTDPTKYPEVILEMKRMHRKLGRSARQAQGITADILEKMLETTDSSHKGLRDRALLLIAYDTLCRRSELISLQIEDVKTSRQSNIERTRILLRRSKTDQESTGRWLHLSERAHSALRDWLRVLGETEGPLFRGITNGQKFTKQLGAGQVNRIYKGTARNAHLDEELIRRISGHSCRVGAAQDLLASGASLPIIMSKGRWSKTDTVMRYVEHMNYSG